MPPERHPCTHPPEERLTARIDTVDLRARGVTEVLIDLNFSRRITSPDVDADEALARAEAVIDALAP
jgi:hypothetical protein